MIWSVVSKWEMTGSTSSPVFSYYKEALGEDNIRLAVVDENDSLDFVKESDVVLLRTASENLVNTINERKINSTAESNHAYRIAKDKTELYSFLASQGISTPSRYSIDRIVNGKEYFVKPRYGGDNKGIIGKCICKSVEEVKTQIERIMAETGQEATIEDYISGTECTVACVKDKKSTIHAFAIEQDESNEWKPMSGNDGIWASRIAKEVFTVLNLRHHARIDIRKDCFGRMFVIDANLIPTLGPNNLFAKCLFLAGGMSYKEAVNAVIWSSSRP